MEPEVTAVLEAAPEFVDRYLDLVEATDGDPGAAATLTELADYAADLLAHVEDYRPALARCLDAVEKLAGSSTDTQELVAGAFLESLSPDDLRLLSPWLGPCTRALLDELQDGAR